ncbi:hypothetical protein QQ020_23445 [Fulvivirgaceae bacterium BMA12]|uniref:Uncharacterized protein n=1 Tax=Agaribacillus aureus TaxID=3051825 RepID=A0ABT8LCW4_9BACT|nr:hypothetical protein [Fulvivirgaceae bacterium BMA12]
MNIPIRSLLPVFTVAVSLYFGEASNAQITERQPADPTEQPVNDNTDIQQQVEKDIRRHILKEIIKRAWQENPRNYEAHREGLKGSGDALLMRMKLAGDRYQGNFYRILPGTDYINISEVGLIGWESRKKDYDIEMRRKMAKNPEEVDKLSDQVADHIMDWDNAPKHFKEVYEATRLHEGQIKLPFASSFEGLRLQYPDFFQKFLDKLNDEQRQRFFNKKMSSQECANVMKISKKEFHVFIQNTFQSDPTPQKKLTPKDKLKLQREAERREHKEDMRQAYDNLRAGISILGMFDENAAHEFESVGNAALQIYDGMKNIQIDGASLTSMGSIAAGINILTSMGRKRESAESKMLKQVLDNQKKMMAQLSEIHVGVKYVRHTLAYMISLMEHSQRRNDKEFLKINERLNDIQKGVYEDRETTKILEKEKKLREIKSAKDKVLDSFHYESVGPIHSELWKALQNPNNISKKADEKIREVHDVLSDIASLATSQLDSSKLNSVFTDKRDIGKLSVEELKYKIGGTTFYQDTGMLPGIGKWLRGNLAVNFKSSVIYGGDTLTANINGSGLDIKNLFDPDLFSDLFYEYVDLAFYRPLLYGQDSVVIRDQKISAFCDDLGRFGNAIDQMRFHLPLALAVFDHHLNKLDTIHSVFIEDMAQRNRIIFNLDSAQFKDFVFEPAQQEKKKLDILYDYTNDEGKHVCFGNSFFLRQFSKGGMFSKGSSDIFYRGASTDSIKKELSKLHEKHLFQIGEWCGVFQRGLRAELKKKREIRGPVSPSRFGSERYEGPISGLYRTVRHDQIIKRYISLSPALKKRRPNLPEYIYEEKIYQHDQDVRYKRGKKLPTTRGSKYLSEGKIRKSSIKEEYIDILATEIKKRQHQIEAGWGQTLRDNEEEILGDLYRAHFVVKTFLRGGYGKHYMYVSGLEPISDAVYDMEQIYSLITTKWLKGESGLDIHPAEIRNYGVIKEVDYDFYTKSENVLKWEEKGRKINYLTSSMKLPDLPKRDIGYLKKAYKAMEAASPFEDIRPHEDCFPSFE